MPPRTADARTAPSPAELLPLLREFAALAALPGPPRERLDAWAPVRAAARRHFDTLLECERFAQDVSEAALWRLLPHAEHPLPRRHEAFIHPLAPAVARDVRGWFEGAGRVRSDQWPELGRALFDFVRRVTDHPGELWQACEAFLAVPGAAAFTSELVSPILNALRPSDFPLVDAATRTVLNHATGSAFSGSLRDYPAAHVAARRLLADLRPALAETALCDRRPEDAFEGFCHWLVHVRLMRRDEAPPAPTPPAPVAEVQGPRPAQPCPVAEQVPETPVSPAAAEPEPEPVEVSEALDTCEAFDATSEPPDAPPAPAGAPAQDGEADAAVPVSADIAAALVPDDAPLAEPDPAQASPPEPVAEAAAAVAPAVQAEPPPAPESARESAPPPVAIAPPAAATLLDRARAALLRRGQLVLAGPPGSGKSHLARRLADDLVAGGDGLVEHLVFHPAWRYADFVQALRPDGSRQPGRFTAFCRLAAARKGPCVLLIDDAERAELADVFGEALALLDARGREVALAGGGSLIVPPNLRLLLTLDASGRSGRAVLAQLLPACAVLRVDGDVQALRARHPDAAFVERLLDLRRALDAEIGDPERSLPLGFFLRADLPGELPELWRSEVEPWLAEALAGEPTRAAAFRWEAVAERLLPG